MKKELQNTMEQIKSKKKIPKENNELYQSILNYNGLIVSEYDDDFEANSKSFLERNRIVSGLSIGVLIVEGAYRSGTSVTAKITINENKKVFCIPSSLNSKNGYIPNNLIRNGGILVTSPEDIIQEYPQLQIQTENIKEEPYINPLYEKIYNLIKNEPIHINEIIENSNMSLEQINYQLMMLELDGYIVALPGKNYIRRY